MVVRRCDIYNTWSVFRIFKRPCIFFLLYKIFTIFQRFLTTFRRFSKICPKARSIFRIFPNIFRRLSKTTEEDPKIFRSYTNKYKCISGQKYDIFTWRICSHVRILYRFYQLVTTRYTTNFNIIKDSIYQRVRVRVRLNNNKIPLRLYFIRLAQQSRKTLKPSGNIPYQM